MIIYIHGFNTGAMGHKANVLASHFDKTGFYRSNLPYHPPEAIALLKMQIRELQDRTQVDANRLLLVGSSLGGFYARYLSSLYGVNCVLINPSIDPVVSLQQAIGDWTNYVTHERYCWSMENVESLKQYYIENAQVLGKMLVLLDKGDEVLNAGAAIDLYQEAEFAQVTTFEGGNHQFQHLNESLPIIQKFYNTNCMG